MHRSALAFLPVLAFLGGCQRGATAPMPASQDRLQANVPAAPPATVPPEQLKSLGYIAQEAGRAVAGAQVANAQPLNALEALVASRKLIRTGQLTVEVGDYAVTYESAARVVAQFGGYVADTRVARSDSGRRRGTLVLRIPAEHFEDAWKALKGLGTVRVENVSSQDVTKAYADLETRLKVKRETLERLRDILRRQTGKLSDVLEVEREIARVTEEIEQMEGERRYYDQQIALSTLTLELYEPEPLVAGGALSAIGEALRGSLAVFSQSLAAIVYAGAAALPWACLAYLGLRLLRLLRRRRSA
jgi:hypothetical protein